MIVFRTTLIFLISNLQKTCRNGGKHYCISPTRSHKCVTSFFPICFIILTSTHRCSPKPHSHTHCFFLNHLTGCCRCHASLFLNSSVEFTKNKEFILHNYSTAIKIKKFHIDTILLCNLQSKFKFISYSNNVLIAAFFS